MTQQGATAQREATAEEASAGEPARRPQPQADDCACPDWCPLDHAN